MYPKGTKVHDNKNFTGQSFSFLRQEVFNHCTFEDCDFVGMDDCLFDGCTFIRCEIDGVVFSSIQNNIFEKSHVNIGDRTLFHGNQCSETQLTCSQKTLKAGFFCIEIPAEEILVDSCTFDGVGANMTVNNMQVSPLSGGLKDTDIPARDLVISNNVFEKMDHPIEISGLDTKFVNNLVRSSDGGVGSVHA